MGFGVSIRSSVLGTLSLKGMLVIEVEIIEKNLDIGV